MKRVGSVPLEQLKNGALVRVEYPPFDVVVAMIEGVPMAIEDACNHAGASLAEGSLSDLRPGCVVCPMHGYVFSMRDGSLVAPKGLCSDQRAFVTKLEGDDVVVFDAVEITVG